MAVLRSADATVFANTSARTADLVGRRITDEITDGILVALRGPENQMKLWQCWRVAYPLSNQVTNNAAGNIR